MTVLGFVAPVAIAIACAGLTHFGLSVGERTIFPDEDYKRIMLAGHEKKARAEVIARLRALKKANKPLPKWEETEALRARLEQKYKPFPLDPVLFGALIISLLTGIFLGHGVDQKRTDRRSPVGGAPDFEVAMPTWTQVGTLAWVLGAALGLVIVLRIFQ
jgi:hypothetical protein